MNSASMFTLRQAQPEDFNSVCTLYQKIIASLESRTNFPLWTWGVHPSQQSLKEALDNREIWLFEQNGQLCGSAFVNRVLEGEEQVSWQGNDAWCIHLFGIDPVLGGKGLSDRFLQGLLAILKEKRADSIRLNLIEGNDPARNLYTRNGFEHRGHYSVWLDDEGFLPFEMMEKLF